MIRFGTSIVPRLLLVLGLLTSMASAELRRGGSLPVVQKVQIVFSMVSHHHDISDRISFYDSHGGNESYAVPHLVYEPIVTLYNPYPEPLRLDLGRIRIWDPPVGFRLKKGSHYLRDEFEVGEFHSLARFQAGNEGNPDARKTFTMVLTDSLGGRPGARIVLQPGETRTYSAWVEQDWTWQNETRISFYPRSFFDWNRDSDFTNEDGRPRVRYSNLGFGCVPGWDPRAGFQTDNLSRSFRRPPETAYAFEESATVWATGWVTVRLADTVSVEARAVDVVQSTSEPDFRISVLGGSTVDPERDICQDFHFDFEDVVQKETALETDPVVSRTYRVGDILQTPMDPTPGGKSIFAVLTAVARNESLASGALEELGEFDGNDHYEVRFEEASDFMFFYTTDASDTPARVEKPAIICQERTDDELRFALASPRGKGPWRVMGGTSPGALTEDLTPSSAIVPGPSSLFGADLHFLRVDLTGKGPRYFLKVVEGAE